MKVKDWKKQNPDKAHKTVWAADSRGGFGKKGWSAYGNTDDLEIVRVEKLEKSWADVKLHVWDYSWGDPE